ncbi:mitochondrial dicarboxylate carrier-like isoform X6 [Petaurus breviceps papuanus]|uniref:mitochondrial dicarboxylate carrier-like isoform X6 n=1 Tax=Petaurus breviceps papuanus TaxID=3040969 RepID=UPI0036DF0B0B
MGKKTAFRWYFGGLASVVATCVTHPLDLIKVHLQTQHRANIGFTGTAMRVISFSGFMALYNGLSASLCRQLTYSVTRFAIYHSMRDHVIHNQKQHLYFYQKVYMAALGEGFLTLFSGAPLASGRGALMTVAQASGYDQLKQLVLTLTSFSDSLSTHIIASFIAGLCATLLCQPLDVLKTRMMNTQDYDGIIHCISKTAKLGPLAFYKGTFPAAIRLIPHTILTFVFLEQLRLNYGISVKSDLGQD